MAQQQQQSRARSGTSSSATGSTASHPVSLKVLRLSQPTLATQIPLPATDFGNGIDIPVLASRAGPETVTNSQNGGQEGAGIETELSSFPLTPLLTLPAAFGAAYVGEAFVCTVCANVDEELGTGAGAGGVGELLSEKSSSGNRSVRGIKLKAELQTPSAQQGVELELRGPGSEESSVGENEDEDDILHSPGSTLQRTLRYDLKDDGPHVLAVTLTYTETSPAGVTRIRTFRKLYQFVAQPLIAVRSKITERHPPPPLSTTTTSDELQREWVLEAQLENVGDTSVVLDSVWLKEWSGIQSVALNSPTLNSPPEGEDRQPQSKPSPIPPQSDILVLKPQDIEQVMFHLFEAPDKEQDEPDEKMAAAASLPASRVPLAQLNVQWHGAMGEKGCLTTGWLARARAR